MDLKSTEKLERETESLIRRVDARVSIVDTEAENGQRRQGPEMSLDLARLLRRHK